MKIYIDKSIIISILKSLSTILAIVVLWIVSTNENTIIPSPQRFFGEVGPYATSDLFLRDMLHSLKRVLIGFLVGVVAAGVVGTAMTVKGISPFILPVTEIIRAIPPIAWIPLSLILFGYGDPSAYFLVSLGAFFPVLSAVVLAHEERDPRYDELSITLKLSAPTKFKDIIFPQYFPIIFDGMKTGIGISWMIVVAAELVGAQSGLGYLIQISRAQLQLELVIFGMLTIGFLGYGMSFLLFCVEKKIFPWRFRIRS